MQTAQELLERMASFDPGDALVLSVYLDMRPHATGENPALRHAQVILKDRLRTIEILETQGDRSVMTITEDGP